MRRRLLAGISLIALMAGCGSGASRTNGPLTASEIRRGADSVCRQVAEGLAQIAQSTDGLSGNPQDVLAVTHKGLTELAHLRPPAQLRKRFDRFLRQVRKREEERGKVLAVIRSAPRRLGPPVHRFNHFTTTATRTAEGLNLKQCPGF